VVSERSDFDPYGGGVVFCDYDRIVECCDAFLAPGMESDRCRIAELGYKNLKALDTAGAIQRALANLP
jgi:hypothetical protein